MDNIVSLAQYDDVNTWGIQSMREVEELNKALEAGYQRPPESGGSALRVESLEGTLKVLTYTQKHFAFWAAVPKKPAYSTAEEFNQLTAYGGETGAFVPEGILPETEDTTYARQVELVKFLGTTRSVTHPMTLVRTMIGDVVAQENQNGIMWILRNMEWGLFNGDADMCYNGTASGSSHREWVEFNGLESSIDSANVVDLKGAALEESDVSDATQMIASAYGIPTDIFLSFATHKKFCDQYFGGQRFAMPSQDGYSVGINVRDVKTPFGNIRLNPDVFLNTGRVPISSVATGLASLVPDAPATVASASMTGSTGVWATHGGAATYDYAVSAANRYGESTATAMTAVTVTSSDLTKYIPITITNANPLSVAPEYFNIYKTEADGSTLYFVGRVRASSQAAGGTTTWNDTGLWMANTAKAYVGEMSEQILAVKQLAPLMKMDLAVLAPAIRWMILLYATMLLYAPKKWVQFINIG